MKKSRIVIILVIVMLVAVSAAGLLTWRKISTLRKATIVRVEQAQHGELIEFVSAPGEIEPSKKVEISAKVSARVIELPYKEGDRVSCGDPNTNPSAPPARQVLWPR